MLRKKILILNSLILSTLIISGCSVSFKGSKTVTNDAGVYKTDNKGEKWQQQVLIPTTAGNKSIGGLNTNVLAMDPSDNKAIYFGSVGNGLFYTYNGAASWNAIENLTKETIQSVAVDPKSKCTIYASFSNQVYKTTDCSRTWERMYYDNSTSAKIKSIVIDHYESSSVFIGTSQGNIIKSLDGGSTWKIIKNIGNIKEIYMSPNDSRKMFALTENKELYRTTDGGGKWDNLEESLKKEKSAKIFHELVLPKSDDNLLFLVTDSSILKSIDDGDNWKNIKLIGSSKGAAVNSFAINSGNASEMYYVTNTTFNRSLDGGQNWTTKKLPTTGAGWKLLLDPKNPNIIYMGVKKLAEK